ncbi:putative outer membrane starch-binding protein [Chitinophaga dinghuensis]|uniref:Putative outer membrane starch-binding protein n=1 Tax=Chitinophaga dinghuensis TaxID=1539050 RepID=A0A327VZL0_9BACT|nr:RagB/SusD family nutrient uptake outer membrane protein [Chitinophaga dinghuensis]RAJ81823.1 putative outer membrane starch-binding protein [Chitinophaga dinghuensis]
MRLPHYKSKIIPALLLSIGCLASACKKMVDINPPIDTIDNKNVFNSPDKVNAAVSGLYFLMMKNTGEPTFSNGSTTCYAGMMADELVPSMGTTIPEDYQFYTNKLLLSNPKPGPDLWSYPYKVIYAANAILEGIAGATSPAITDSIKKQAIGESRLARAFALFYLTNFYGDIPTPMSTNVLIEGKQPRQPIDKVYQIILDDLKAAIELLPDNYAVTNGEKVRPNRYAAIALLARVYLYRQQWQEAAATADKLISSGQFSLTTLENAFEPNSKEAIWQLLYDMKNGQSFHIPESMNLMPALSISMLDEASQEFFTDPANFESVQLFIIPTYILSDHLTQAFEPGDQRFNKWTDSLRAPAVAPWNGIEYRFARKYVQANPDGTDAHPYYTVFRLAEQYLIRAEAQAQLGDVAGAASDLNAIRSRAGLPATAASSKEALLTAIAHERQIELFAEWGHRWFDLKRTNKATTVLSAIKEKQPWSDNNLLLFIPPLEIQNDPMLKQNPGYTW